MQLNYTLELLIRWYHKTFWLDESDNRQIKVIDHNIASQRSQFFSLL